MTLPTNKVNTKDQMSDFISKQKRQKDMQRLDEIEEILLEMPFTNPEFEKLVSERNNILIKIQK